MRSATRLLLAAFALLTAGTAAAQNDVTFQVDMNPYITSCQFNPATMGVTTPGDMNGWDNTQYPLADADGNGIYTGTYSLPEGTINYKHYITNNPLISWENDPNRNYTVTAGAQTIPATAFNGPTPTPSCSSTNVDYTLTFAVNMSIQIGRGAFNPSTQRVGVTGVINGWNATGAWILQEDSSTPGLYVGSVDQTLAAPGNYPFKFIITDAPPTNVVAWENVDPAVTNPVEGGNRVMVLTGNEPLNNGRRDFVYDNNTDPTDFPYFSDVTAAQFLGAPATVTYNVDLRSAQYALAANGGLPGGVSAITSLAINGPAAGESQQDGGPGGGLGDWIGWGDVLENTPERQLTDANGDGIWSITLNYNAGAARALVAKFGVNGEDNESGFGGDHQLPITEGTNTFNLAFGCVRRNVPYTGATRFGYVDETGSNPVFNTYDEYLLINNVADPATCITVTSGGVAGDVNGGVAVEGGPQIAGLTIGAAYPNPVAGRASLALTLERPMDVAARLFDVTGRQVAVLADGSLSAGTTTVSVDASGLAAGVYVLRVEADGQVVSRRLTVTR